MKSPTLRLAILGMTFTGACLNHALATTYTWNSNSSPNWATPANWTPGGTPGAADTIVSSGTAGLQMGATNRTITELDFTLGSGTNWTISSSGAVSQTLTVSGLLDASGAGGLTLRPGSASNSMIVSIGSLGINGGGSVSLGIATTGQGQMLSGLTVGTTSISGASALSVVNGSSTGSLGDVTMAGSGLLNIFNASSGAGSLTVNSLNGGANNVIRTSNVTAASSTVSGTLTINSTSSSNYGGKIIDAGSGVGAGSTTTLSVIKSGASSQTFSGANTYSGGTIINAGTLLVSGTGTVGTGNLKLSGGAFDITGVTASNYTLGTGQTLSGTGAITATGKTLEVAGTFSPGATTGTLAVSGGMQFDSTSQLNFDINGTSAGLFDRLAVAGTLTLDGTLNLTTGYSAQLGDTVDLLDWTTEGGQFHFASITGTSLGGGLSWDTSSLYTNGTITVVPEPQSAALLIAGGLALVIFRRRGFLGRSVGI